MPMNKKSWFARLFSSDHRKSARKPAPGLVAYYWDGGAPMAHEIQNISSTGFYLLTKQRWLPGTILTLTLQKPGIADSHPELYIAVQSKVVRLGEDGIGFVFVQLERQGSHRDEASKSRPVGKKALETFLEQLKSGLGHGIARPSGGAWFNGAAAWRCLEEMP